MNQRALKEYAERNGFSIDLHQKEKLILVPIPALPAGNQIQIYFPFDTDLQDAIITRIRCPYNPTVMNSPFTPSGVGLATIGAFPQFVVNFVNKNGVYLYENFPIYQFLRTAVINRQCDWHILMRFQPDRSFLTYFDVANTRSGFSFPFIFTYHLLKK